MPSVARRLAAHVLEAVIKSRSTGYKRHLFRQLGTELGVSTFSFTGSLGTFQGATQDEFIFLGYFLTGTWAPELQALLHDVFPTPGKGTLIDVGANIGLTSIPIARERGIRCYALEPEPRNFRLLTWNVAENGVTDLVHAVNVAAADRDEVMTLELSEENRGDHRLRLGAPVGPGLLGEGARQTISVPARRLDDVLAGAELVAPVVLKIDTQGADVSVLRGADRLLGFADYVIVEYFPYALRRAGASPSDLGSLLARFPRAAILSSARHEFGATEAVLAEARRRVPDDAGPTMQVDLVLAR